MHTYEFKFKIGDQVRRSGAPNETATVLALKIENTLDNTGLIKVYLLKSRKYNARWVQEKFLKLDSEYTTISADKESEGINLDFSNNNFKSLRYEAGSHSEESLSQRALGANYSTEITITLPKDRTFDYGKT